jgi:hypothetical protein
MIARSSQSPFPTKGEDHNPWAERFAGGVFPIDDIKNFVRSLGAGEIQPGMDHPLRQGQNVELFDEIARDPAMQGEEFEKNMAEYLGKMRNLSKEMDEEMADAE